MILARDLLEPLGKGIEIGASANNPFPGVTAWNVELFNASLFQKAQREISGAVAPIDLFGTAQKLPIADHSVNFVLASHVLEHMPDTIRALREWDRVVNPGGLIFMIVPHRELTFDRVRPRTKLEHHLADYAQRMNVEQDPLVPTSHYHVWLPEDLMRLIDYLILHGLLDWKIEATEEIDSKTGNGFTIVAGKKSRTSVQAEPQVRQVAFHQLTLSLPFQAVGRTLETLVPGAELVVPPGLPRGLYSCLPVFEGFPPVCGDPIDIEVGPPVPPPRITSTRSSGSLIVFHGEHFTTTTWLEASFPGGQVHRILPDFDDGRLTVNLEGLHPPADRAQVTPVNLRPGGGPGPAYMLHIDPA